MSGGDILLAEDDRTIRRHVASLLAAAGHSVRGTRDGRAALRAFGEARPDLVLLDVMMPVMDGFAVCREIRRKDPFVPILFLTALESEADQLKGLGFGADDYVFKTAGDAILLARVAAAFRRQAAASCAESFPVGTCQVDATRLLLRADGGAPQAISERELALLRIFAERPGELLSRDSLMARLWGPGEEVSENALSVVLSRLRTKMGSSSESVVAVRGAGCVFRPRADE